MTPSHTDPKDTPPKTSAPYVAHHEVKGERVLRGGLLYEGAAGAARLGAGTGVHRPKRASAPMDSRVAPILSPPAASAGTHRRQPSKNVEALAIASPEALHTAADAAALNPEFTRVPLTSSGRSSSVRHRRGDSGGFAPTDSSLSASATTPLLAKSADPKLQVKRSFVRRYGPGIAAGSLLLALLIFLIVWFTRKKPHTPASGPIPPSPYSGLTLTGALNGSYNTSTSAYPLQNLQIFGLGNSSIDTELKLSAIALEGYTHCLADYLNHQSLLTQAESTYAWPEPYMNASSFESGGRSLHIKCNDTAYIETSMQVTAADGRTADIKAYSQFGLFPTPSASPSPTASITASPTGSITASPTSSASASPTATLTITPSISVSPSASPIPHCFNGHITGNLPTKDEYVNTQFYLFQGISSKLVIDGSPEAIIQVQVTLPTRNGFIDYTNPANQLPNGFTQVRNNGDGSCTVMSDPLPAKNVAALLEAMNVQISSNDQPGMPEKCATLILSSAGCPDFKAADVACVNSLG